MLAASLLSFTIVVFTLPHLSVFETVVPPIQLGALTFWIPYVGYFVAGYALSICTISRLWIVASAGGLVALGALTVLQSAYPDRFAFLWQASPVEHLGLIVAAYSITVFVVGTRLLARARLSTRVAKFIVELSESSFGVFLAHLIVLLVPYHFLPGFHNQQSLIEALLAYVFIGVASFAIVTLACKTPFLRVIV